MRRCDTLLVRVVRRATAPRQLRLWVQIPLGHGCLSFVSVMCCLGYIFDYLINIHIILINMRTNLTLLFIRKLCRAQTARHQNKYGGRARAFLNAT